MSQKKKKLDRSFFERDSKQVAKDLLGKLLIKNEGEKTLKGKIVETEAYYGYDDSASRVSQNGRTDMTEIMWDYPGKIFVYMVHNNWMFNFITESKGEPGAVLIRAVEPLEGTETMKERRDMPLKRLTDGPGKLTEAFGINKKFKGNFINECSLSLKRRQKENFKIEKSGRIGISEGKDKQWRFYIKGNKFVSK